MKKGKSYHHGNLREVLLRSAIQLIAKVGPSGLTLREVARRAGVSHAAPYRHFKDKEDLIAAVATQGFEELNRAMVRSAHQGSDTLDSLKRAGIAYVAFALRRPEHFTVMFDTAAFSKQQPEAVSASEQCFGTLLTLVQRCVDEAQLPQGDVQEMALVAWSMVHGIAKLAIAGKLGFRSKAKVLEFADFAISELLRKGSLSTRS